MAGNRKAEEAGISSAGPWLVTFTDCMTNLMTFFVLLLTFSSFDDVERQQLGDIFGSGGFNSIFPISREVNNSYMPPSERVLANTATGSEKPTDSDTSKGRNPNRLPVILEDDAYKDRKTLYIPSQRLFWGEGTVLTAEGRDHLRMIASFMEMVPSRAVISEAGLADMGQGQDAALERAWAVVQFLAAQKGLRLDWLNIAASTPPVPARLKGQRVVAVTLVSGRAF
jgi:hypothetical protein